MTDRWAALAISITLTLAASAAWAQFPANPEFADGAAGWALPEGAEVGANEGTRGALSLPGGWARSGASEQPLTGWQRVEVRVKGPGKGAQSRLLLALAPDAGELAAQVALSAEDAGSGWHTLSAELLPPPGAPASVAIGVEGGGPWLIDSVTVAATDPPAAEPFEDAAIFAEPLPEGWEPEGLLDAISRPIAGTSELIVQVGGLEVTMPPMVMAARGHRGTIRLAVRNRSMKEKDLTVAVAGPPGFFAPERTVVIRLGADTVFEASLQAFRVGTFRARMTFRSDDSEASAPVEIEVVPSYPAPGVACIGAAPPAELLAALPALGVPLIATAPATGLRGDLTRLWLLPSPWSEEAVATAVTRIPTEAEFAAVYYPRGGESDGDGAAPTRALRRAADDAQVPLFLLGPPADLLPGPPPTIAEADLAVAATLGSGGNISAPSLRLPILGARPARKVMLDRANVTGPQPCWTAVAAALEIDQAPAAIRQSARLPMFFADLAARSTGSAECDAALLARTLAVCAWQGATGWTIAARPEDAPEGADAWTLLDAAGELRGPVGEAYCELSRELAAAIPVSILKQSPEIGSAPTASVGFRPFIRNDEGILALWNNTGAPVDLIFEPRTQPLDVHTVSVGPEGVRRGYVGAFHYSDDAVALNRPVVFVTLGPGEFRVLSMQLARPFVGWLSSVEFKPNIPRGGGNKPRSFGEEWDGRSPRG